MGYTRVQKAAAWAVHGFTAAGAVVGLMAVIEITRTRFIAALVLMGVTIAIDSFDGTLARKARVKEVLPQFHGALLDNIVDYFTYVMVPAYFLYMAGLVPYRLALPTAAAVTLASCYQFAQADAKTSDCFFLGFPSYWNIVVFYLFLLGWPQWVNLAIILVLVAGVFLPVKYLYPSRTPVLFKTTFVLSVIWGVLAVIALFTYPGHHKLYICLSLIYVVYYFGMSFYFTARHSRDEGTE
jgi:phosphatidylcholine synthase